VRREVAVAKCQCDGQWRSTAKVHVDRHHGSKKHREWALANGQPVVEPYKPKTSRSQNISDYLVTVEDAIQHPEPEAWLIDGEGLWFMFDKDIYDCYLCNPHHADSEDNRRYKWEDHYKCRVFEYGEVFFHHSELSEAGLMAVLACWGGLPKTERECAVRMKKHDDLVVFLCHHRNVWESHDSDMSNQYANVVRNVFTETERILTTTDDDALKRFVSSSLVSSSSSPGKREVLLKLIRLDLMSGDHHVEADQLRFFVV